MIKIPHRLTKNAELTLEILRSYATAEKIYRDGGRAFAKVFIADARAASPLPPARFATALANLTDAGMLIDWIGDDRFAAVAMADAEPMVEIPLSVAKLLHRAFLPQNPNKVRRGAGEARRELQAACRTFHAAMIRAAGNVR